MAEQPLRPWDQRDWRDCRDRPSGQPRYFRCARDYRLVTDGQSRRGGCLCGNRKLAVATGLSYAEIALLKLGYFPLTGTERSEVRPLAYAPLQAWRKRCLVWLGFAARKELA